MIDNEQTQRFWMCCVGHGGFGILNMCFASKAIAIEKAQELTIDNPNQPVYVMEAVVGYLSLVPKPQVVKFFMSDPNE